MFGDIFDVIVDFTRDQQAYIVPIVFGLGFGESLVFVSLFIPSTALFLAIGAADSAAGGSFWPVWVAGASGAILGDIVSFGVGRYLRSDVGKVWPFNRDRRLLARGRLMFLRWGMMTVFVSKFLGTVRPFIPVVAGALRMDWWRFMPASIVSCIGWAGLFLAPGYGVAFIWS